jgi:glutamate/tyrosine decarboxylase-like PLP-dependent enzyme
VLVRDHEQQQEAFSVKADYLSAPRGGVAALTPKLSDFGIQLSRSFKALKVWMCLKEHGTAKLGRLVHQNVQQASYLAARVREHPELELAAPVPLNIVCFRYVGDGGPSLDLDEVNRELLIRLQESGVAVPSHTLLRGRYVLRAAITNHRSRREDFDAMVSAVVRIGRELVSSGEGRAVEGAP